MGENYDGTVSDSYATGAVSGDEYVGGLVGGNYTDATISDSYATGAVSGSSYVGGLVGINSDATISDSYATGAVSGSTPVGGLVGDDEGIITDSYWDTQTSGITDVTAGAGNIANDPGIAGETTAALSSALPSGFSSAVWGNVNNQTTPYLLALTSNPQTVYVGADSTDQFNLVFTLAQVQAINTSSTTLSENYALATSLDATGVSGWVPIGTDGAGTISNSDNGFSGIFDGLGNTISNLTVDIGSYNFAGLFGWSSGTIRDIGMVGGSVSGGGYVGGLVGGDGGSGTVSDSYATGAVSGSNYYVGGLVGINYGSISDSYATGAVSSSNYYVGGLVGINYGSNSDSYATGAVSGSGPLGGLVGDNFGGAISDSYATGAVSGSSYVGGLVGINIDATIGDSYATISDSYATGAVSGSSYVGGLVGYDGGTITASYWDTQTSGITDVTAGAGNIANDSGIAGKTTAQLTAALPSGFSSAVWGNVNNQTTPYLLAFGTTEQQVYVGSDSTDLFNLVFTLAQVQAINASNTALSENYALANSLDATGVTGWIPIGTDGAGNIGNSSNGFSGNFDGLGNTISNHTVDIGSNSYAGLFGYSSGTITDIGMVGGSVSGGGGTVGGLVGKSTGTVSDSYATGTVSGSGFVGGLVGCNTGTVSNSHATGAVSGSSDDVGGLVGDNGNIVTDSYATGAVTSTSDLVGGLVGVNESGTISDSYATGAVSGDYYVGGLVGYNEGAISDSYAIGSVSGSGYVGGLTGYNSSTVSDSYATGAVSGSDDVGGLVGFNNGGTVSDSYATGAVSSGSEVGGLVGDDGGTITDSYWDTQTSGITDLTKGAGSIANDPGIAGLTTAQLQGALPGSFSNSVWGKGAGLFPYFLWQYPSGTPQAISRIRLHRLRCDRTERGLCVAADRRHGDGHGLDRRQRLLLFPRSARRDFGQQSAYI